MKIKIRVIKRH